MFVGKVSGTKISDFLIIVTSHTNMASDYHYLKIMKNVEHDNKHTHQSKIVFLFK